MGGNERSGDSDQDGIALDTIPLHSTNLLTVLDPTGVVRYESPSIERIFGFDQDELVGERVDEYFHPEDAPRVLEAFETVVTSDEHVTESVEYRHERADGSYVWVESVASSDPTPDGYYVINTTDISTWKRHQRELEATNDRLDEFAGVVSHDLRNPLTVASARLELLEEDIDSEHLEPIARAHERMRTLIDDLLTLAQSGDRIDETEWVDLAALADAAWWTISTADASLAVDIEREIRADRSRLQQLLENLLRNSIEHGGDAATISIGALPESDGFYVADDGPGIAPDARDRVFESGFSTGNDGAGLGLAIVREIVRAHGWHVRVTDGQAGGARFEISGVEFR